MYAYRTYYERTAEPLGGSVYYKENGRYSNGMGYFHLHENYVWKCFVEPCFRNKGIYKDMLRAAVTKCYENGYLKAYIACNDKNEYSKRGIISVGFKEIFHVPQTEKRRTTLLRSVRNLLICLIFGHYWVESATTDLRCARCGRARKKGVL